MCARRQSRARILVVDDEPRNVLLLERILGRAGYDDVRSTSDPSEAVPIFQEYRPDLVLVDLLMPQMDGFEVMRRIRTLQPEDHFLPIAVLTADTSPEARNHALADGANDFIAKPFEPTEVRHRIENLLEIRRLQESLEERVAERTADLERSNAHLTHFAHIASHDLKEPLRAISDFAEILDEQCDDLDAIAKDCIDEISSGAERMRTMIDALMTYSSVDAGTADLVPAQSTEMLEHAAANLAHTIEDADATVTHDDLPVVMCDRGQVVQLFQCMLSNSLKFRREEPPAIHVSAADRGAVQEFCFADNGIGIGACEHDAVFRLFERLHTRDQYPGTGIGLAVCRRIVERHDGSIWFESTPGEGTSFFFTLRSADAAPAMREAG